MVGSSLEPRRKGIKKVSRSLHPEDLVSESWAGAMKTTVESVVCGYGVVCGVLVLVLVTGAITASALIGWKLPVGTTGLQVPSHHHQCPPTIF